MNSVALALVPVFSVILIGYFLRVSDLVAREHWPAINHLCYYVLFPVLIVKTLGTADLSSTPVVRLAAAMLVTVVLMSALLFVARKPLTTLLSLDGAAYTSVFQGTTRWHTFAALAIIAALYGDQGLTIATIGVATMIPVLNLLNVTILSLYGKNNGTARPHPLRMVVRNPFIISCAIGIALNMAGLKLPVTIAATLDLVGRGALGISLLTVGAALHPRHITGNLAAVFSTAMFRLLGMPALMATTCLLFGVSGQSFVIAVICAAVPTASASFILARQMGGDAELMASIITFQVMAAMITLPLVMELASRLS